MPRSRYSFPSRKLLHAPRWSRITACPGGSPIAIMTFPGLIPSGVGRLHVLDGADKRRKRVCFCLPKSELLA